MSKFARAVSTVASVVAVVAPFFGPVGVVVGMVAAAVAVTAGIVAQVTAKRPGAQGAINQVSIGNNMPIPWAVGRTYVGGSRVYDNSGGDENRFRFNINVISAAGPIEGIETTLADYAPIAFVPDNVQGAPHLKATGFYSDFMWSKRQLGARPESVALIDGRTSMPDWGGATKLSGFAAHLIVMKFDKDAKRFTGGVPELGVVGKMTKLYDPRKDDTYPGGMGPQRWDDEDTWTWSENAALVALSYARGRYVEKNADGSLRASPVKLLGLGLRHMPSAIRIADFVELANLSDANGWKAGGTIYEAPGVSKWANLKRILEVAAAEPVWTGGELRLKISAPRPSLLTVGYDDLADDDFEIRAMKPWKERLNTLVPRYRSPDHRWEYVQAAAVENPTYLLEDGESRTDERQYDLCQDKDQAAKLAAYALVNARESGPWTFTFKPKLMRYRPGECLTLHFPDHGLSNRKASIIARKVDAATGKVTLTFESETDAKHAWALTRVGQAPPTPTIRGAEEIDQIVSDLNTGQTAISQLIRDSGAQGLSFSVAAPIGGSSTVTISEHERVYADKIVSVAGASFEVPAASGDAVFIYYDDALRAGGAVTYGALVVPGANGPTEEAANSPNNPFRHALAAQIVPTTGSTSGGTDAGSGGGGAGWTRYPTLEREA